jgi:hypothetical protein
MRLAFADILALSNIDHHAPLHLSGAQCAELAKTASAVAIHRLRIVDQDGHFPEKIMVEHIIPDLPAMVHGYDDALLQKVVDIVLRVPHAEAPQSLTFWQLFGDRGVFHPIHADLLVRQQGELLMLPPALSPGFPARLWFNWTTPPPPIAKMTSLAGVTPGWKNRPANARLRISPDIMVCALYLHVESIRQLPGAPETADDGSFATAELGRWLAGHLTLALDGEPLQPDYTLFHIVHADVYSFNSGRLPLPERTKTGIAELMLTYDVPTQGKTVGYRWNLYGDTLSMLLTEVNIDAHAGRAFALHADRPTLLIPVPAATPADPRH